MGSPMNRPELKSQDELRTQLLKVQQREYASWLGEVEHGVVLPLKWVFLVLCAFYWLWSRDWALPPPEVFGLFILFAFVTAGQHYFLSRDRVTPLQVRPFVLGSYFIDGLFASFAVVVDTLGAQPPMDRPVISDYFTLYILLVLRGFALFRTKTENFSGFLFVSGLFFVTATFQIRISGILEYMPAIQKLVLIWSVMLLAQAFIGLIAEKKEGEIRARERHLRSASLASLGELSAGVAHEINNPIGIIKTYADYLSRSVTPEDPMQEDFLTIRKEAERCEEIVRRMLDFSNPQIQGFSSIDLPELLSEVTAFVFHEGRKDGIEARTSVSGEIPRVSGDAVQLKQAFMNLLVNARQILSDFREDGAPTEYRGIVSVEVSRSGGPRPPVVFEVKDNGPGISPDDAEKVFEPFFTKRKKGTGLGLAITRRIIEAHSGTIRIAPRPEGGTVVTVILPIEGEEKA